MLRPISVPAISSSKVSAGTHGTRRTDGTLQMAKVVSIAQFLMPYATRLTYRAVSPDCDKVKKQGFLRYGHFSITVFRWPLSTLHGSR